MEAYTGDPPTMTLLGALRFGRAREGRLVHLLHAIAVPVGDRGNGVTGA